MLVQPPLFMQTGKYPAAADRYLIGGLLYPQGGTVQAPRHGIRPSGTTSTGLELSFQVKAVASSGLVEIQAGAAFVKASGIPALNSVYLVVNDAAMQVDCVTGGASGTYSVKLYLEVVDAADSTIPGGTDDAYAKFTVLPAGNAAPETSLLLATVKVESGVSSVTSDDRVYTTTSGGAVHVPSKTSLDTAPLSLAPYGSQAYVAADGLVWSRSSRGWEPPQGAVNMGTDETVRPEPPKVYEGMLWFNKAKGQLQVYVNGGWQTIGQLSGVVADTQGNLATAVKRSFTKATNASHFYVSMPSDGVYRSFDDLLVADVPGVGVPSPSAQSLAIYARVRSDDTVVSVSISGSAWIPSAADLSQYPPWNGFCVVAVTDLTRSGDAGYPPNYMTTGLNFYAKYDVLKSRTVNYHLRAGDYVFQPFVAGVNSPGSPATVIQFHQIIMEVEL